MRFYRTALILLLLTFESSTMAIDLAPLWDFSNPELSERRFREALATASGDDVLILQTQIARTYGLRGDFSRDQEILRDIEPHIQAAGAEARARHSIEFGRTLASAKHTPQSQTIEIKNQARSAYLRAFALAKSEHLDDVAIDALHMLAFVDTAPIDQLKWGQEALGIVEASAQPAAKKWEASLRNNIGYALHQLGRYDEALDQFRRAVVLRERTEDGEAKRAAHWMVAWTLRALNRVDEALEIQLRLEKESEAAGVVDPYVFEELEILLRAKGDTVGADRYAERRRMAVK
jgi:tetratricopeptide (TPR) repeat protein